MATLLLQTNDSTLSRPGLSERGSIYLDLSDDHSAVHWARALWQFGDQVPQADTEPDHARLAPLRVNPAAVYVDDTADHGQPPPQNPGLARHLEGSGEECRDGLLRVWLQHARAGPGEVDVLNHRLIAAAPRGR